MEARMRFLFEGVKNRDLLKLWLSYKKSKMQEYSDNEFDFDAGTFAPQHSVQPRSTSFSNGDGETNAVLSMYGADSQTPIAIEVTTDFVPRMYSLQARKICDAAQRYSEYTEDSDNLTILDAVRELQHFRKAHEQGLLTIGSLHSYRTVGNVVKITVTLEQLERLQNIVQAPGAWSVVANAAKLYDKLHNSMKSFPTQSA